MKVEIGESLVYSFLKHVKNCLVVQTNWKSSGNWHISEDVKEKAIDEFNKIKKHYAFSGIFKSGFEQTIKQAEIDVLGISRDNSIYAFEVAFHENGLQYGEKIKTRDRVFKKLLRSFIALKCYFPNHKHYLAFCSPKVYPTTETHINEYFEILKNGFQSENVEFFYYSNEQFNNEITKKTLAKTISEADSSELFVRSIKLFNLTGKSISKESPKSKVKNSAINTSEQNSLSTGEYVSFDDIKIPFYKGKPEETVQDYVKRIMHTLLDNNIISDDEIENLKKKDYSKKLFILPVALIRNKEDGHKVKGKGRYWAKEIFADKYLVCSQWWKQHHLANLKNIKKWLLDLEESYNNHK